MSELSEVALSLKLKNNHLTPQPAVQNIHLFFLSTLARPPKAHLLLQHVLSAVTAYACTLTWLQTTALCCGTDHRSKTRGPRPPEMARRDSGLEERMDGGRQGRRAPPRLWRRGQHAPPRCES